jgi:hypothetical protein
MTHDPVPPTLPDSVHALSWPEVAHILPPTLTIEISSGWPVVALIALWIWLGRKRR